MSDTLKLPAETRDRAGKGASRDLRRNGRVPAVVYGGKEDPLAIHVELKELKRLMGTGHFFNSIVEVKVGGKTYRTQPKDVAVHPVTDTPLHVDFLRIAKGATIHVNVPVVFENEELAPGLKRGGVLNVVRHDLELVCAAEKIPQEIVIDVTGFEIGESIHFSHVKLPDGVESAITDRDFTIATIATPTDVPSEEEEAAEAAEAEAE